MLFRVLFMICASISFSLLADINHVKNNNIQLHVEKIHNHCLKQVMITSLETKEQKYIAKGSSHFREPFQIPFLSIAQYIREYTKAITTGRGYIPQGALRLRIGRKWFGLWEHETGIMCSADPKTADDSDDGLVKLLDNVNRYDCKNNAKDNKSLINAVKLMLFINKKEKIALEPIA